MGLVAHLLNAIILFTFHTRRILMKINIKAKDFSDKEKLEKTLSNKLKKPMNFLAAHVGTALPFYYEVGYFESGAGFLSIGEAKELHRLFKTQRTKGNGEEGKIDKKKVAMGQVKVNRDGIYEFLVEAGQMKKMEAKGVIKSIKMLKQSIGEFVILKGAPVETMPEEQLEQEEIPVVEGQQDGENNAVGLSKKLESQLDRLEDNLTKILAVVYKKPKEALQANLDKFKKHLATWKKENADNTAALERIETISNDLTAIEQRLTERPEEPQKAISPQQREKINENLVELSTRAEGLLEELSALIA